MADEEQVKRLLAGIDGWNKWREENPDIEIDLAGAALNNADLSTANLNGANLENAHLAGIHLSNTNFSYAKLQGAQLEDGIFKDVNFNYAKLAHANLEYATFREAHFQGADLRYAYMKRIDLTWADLKGAYLRGASLEDALLNAANLTGARLSETSLDGTELWKANLAQTKFDGSNISNAIFSEVDLSNAEGLDEAHYYSPSIVDTKTLQLSRGKISEKFLRGCGLSNWEIESAKLYQPGLSSKEIDDILYRVHDLRAGQALQINPLFISYSHKDNAFVDEMENRLNEKGIRFWRDIHNATAGRLEKVVDRAMRQNPTVLLVLSENSVQSDWVEHEARSARDLEKELKRDVLCPVALDGAWKDCNWPARLREQIMEYNILDFSNWQDKSEFTRKFARLVEGLDLFYKEK